MAWRPGPPGKTLPALARSPRLFATCLKAEGQAVSYYFSYGVKVTPLLLPQKCRCFIIHMLFIHHEAFSYVFFHVFSQAPMEDALLSCFFIGGYCGSRVLGTHRVSTLAWASGDALDHSLTG